MINPIILEDRMAGLTAINGRGEHTTEEEVREAFTQLGTGDFRDAGVFLGSFDGIAGWERHLKGDEVVHIVAGSTHFDIIIDDEKQTLTLDAGMLIVVPQGCWHRFRSPDGVTVLATTPQNDEEHTFVDDPRTM